VDGGARHSAARLDLEQKTLGATERNEQQRTAYRERVAQRPADDFVIIDDAAEHINLTPRYARAPKGAFAFGSVHDGHGTGDAAGGRNRYRRL